MLIDIKSKASRSITVQLPMSAVSARFPAQSVVVRRTKKVKSQSEPVPVMDSVRMPPVLTILAGETVEGLPASFAQLEAIKHAIAKRELVVLKSYRPAAEPEPEAEVASEPEPEADPTPIEEAPADSAESETQARPRGRRRIAE